MSDSSRHRMGGHGDEADLEASVLDALPANVAVLDDRGVIVKVNRGWREFAVAEGMADPRFGVGVNYLRVGEDARGGDFESGHEASRGIRGVLGGRLQEFSMEYPCESRKGQRWFRLLVKRRCAKTSGAVVLHIDITERVEAERETQRCINLLRAVTEGTSDAVFVKDLEGRFLFANEAAASYAGRTVDELMGRDDGMIFGDEGRRLIWENDAHVVLENRAETWEEALTCGGVKRVFLATRAPYRDGAGRIVGTIAVMRDVTERKRHEQQFLRAQRMESLGTLAGGIAHDLNNVLSPIMMSIDLLRRGETDGVRLKLLNTIAGSAGRGAEMVRQVLSFARGVEGQKLHVRVESLLDEVGKIASETFPKNIRVEVKPADYLWAIKGDPTQLHQVLLNLCVNARDSMPAGGVLSVTAGNREVRKEDLPQLKEALPGPYLWIRVEDSGVGMTPEVVERIYEPFFTTKEHGKGTGLGLSTTLAIIRSHEGFLRVESEPGKGTLFEVYLPAVKEDPEPCEAAAEATTAGGSGETILLVDDEDSVRSVMRQVLESSGYRVLEACDGAEGIAVYAKNRDSIAVVIADMMMPVMDGPGMIRVLRRLNPEILIIGTSGIEPDLREGGAAVSGMKHFLPKPYAAEYMLKVLRDVLSERPGAVSKHRQNP